MARIEKRLLDLEEKVQPSKQVKYVVLYAHEEIEGKDRFDNFTDEELAEVEAKYETMYPDHQLDFLIIRYEENWQGVNHAKTR